MNEQQTKVPYEAPEATVYEFDTGDLVISSSCTSTAVHGDSGTQLNSDTGERSERKLFSRPLDRND